MCVVRSTATHTALAAWRRSLNAGAMLLVAVGQCLSAAESPSATLELVDSGGVAHRFSTAQLAALPHVTETVDEHGHPATYSGIPLPVLLRQAGLLDKAPLRGHALARGILAEGRDGYTVLLGLGEIDSSIENKTVLVADRVDGHALTDQAGPLRLVISGDKRPARWVRMLVRIRLIGTTVPAHGP